MNQIEEKLESESKKEKAKRPQTRFDDLTHIRPWRAWISILGDLSLTAIILAAMYHFPSPWFLMIGSFFVARQQYAMGVLGHDAAHSRLFKHRGFNNWMGRFLFNGMMMISWDGYRHTHLLHHYHLNGDEDPDRKFIEQFPMSWRKFIPQCLPDFIGLTWAYLYLFYGWHGFKANQRRILPTAAGLMPGFIINTSLLSLYWFLGTPWLYVFCWLLPMILIVPIYLHIRGICEHSGFGHHKNQMLSSRTVVNPIETFFIAPHNLNYHMEHHANPAIPQYNLQAAHQKLKENQDLPLDNLYKSYWPILRKIIK